MIFGKGYDILGNIAIVKFSKDVSMGDKIIFADEFLREHSNVTTVLEKKEKFKGRLRTMKTEFIAGVNTKEALYRENGCEFRFNVETCYFSPRLSSERKEIAEMIKEGESVLVMFGGVAPFAVVIAKIAGEKVKKIVSVELGRECSKYAEENAKRNKVNVEVIQGDVRKQVPLLKEKFDRIVMARPNLKDSFLDVAFEKIKRGGIIHYYGFYEEKDLSQLKDLIMSESEKAGKKIKVLDIKQAGDIGVRKYRYRVDMKVIN